MKKATLNKVFSIFIFIPKKPEFCTRLRESFLNPIILLKIVKLIKPSYLWVRIYRRRNSFFSMQWIIMMVLNLNQSVFIVSFSINLWFLVFHSGLIFVYWLNLVLISKSIFCTQNGYSYNYRLIPITFSLFFHLYYFSFRT